MPIVIGAKQESDFGDPIGMLGDCHRRIERFLSVLVRVAGERNGAEMTSEERVSFDNALRYFREAAPNHTADEEESLFPRLRESNDERLRNMIGKMEALEQEHRGADRLHRKVDELGGRWLEVGRLEAAQAEGLRAALAGLDSMYRSHIRTEDTELFPTAAAALSDEQRRVIGTEMRNRRIKP